jgi:alpha-1,3/alpha-1,6-mannosyltransferase
MLQNLLGALLFGLAVSVVFVIGNRFRYSSTKQKKDKRKKNEDDNEPLQVTFLHPDLGIGGAERLILDAMLACQKEEEKGKTTKGKFDARIVTNFFDPERCFPDALNMEVIVAGSSLVPRHILGKGHVLFASARMFLAAIWAAVFLADTDVFVVDQVSLAMLPLRILTPRKVFFYCHFPDQLCDPTRMVGNPNQIVSRSLIRRGYRYVFDSIEAATMHFASRIVCNSKFTLGVTLNTFPSLKNAPSLRINNNNNNNNRNNAGNDVSSSSSAAAVLYPPVALDALLTQPFDTTSNPELAGLIDSFTIVSINRYERKKNLPLAIEAFAAFKKNQQIFTSCNKYKAKLVLAGGYDERLPENRDHYTELVELAKKLGVEDDVTFLRSISDGTKRWLLREVASVVVYTPTNEHFGIVPVEAMACRKPVVAVNLGGPLESVGTDRKCGILTDPDASKFAAAFAELHEIGAVKRQEMGENGKARVSDLFTIEAFSTKFCGILEELI